jgi:hypothetical protein
MTIRNKLSILLKSLIIFAALSGVAVSIYTAETLSGKFNMFSYYTIQTNLLAALGMALSLKYLWKDRQEPRSLAIFKGGSLLWIMVTGIFFQILLADRWHPQGLQVYINLSMHIFNPLAVLLNWLVFEKKGQYKPVHLVYWLGYPLLYCLVSLVRGALTGFYPYFFINPVAPPPEGMGSYPAMLGMVAMLVLSFAFLGGLILLADRMMGGGKKH